MSPLNAERYANEAELRSALVRVSEHADGIVLHGGEADERRLLDQPVNAVVGLMGRLAGGVARLTWITSGYGWLAIVVPIIVAAPGYFGGTMTFGTLMMVGGRLQPGAVVAALVRGQPVADRRLACDAVPGRQLPRRARDR